MLKGVFFDLFGTLLIYTDMQKAWDMWLQALYENFKECGLNMAQKSFALKCDGFLAKNEPVINKNKLSVYEKRIYSLGLELNLQLEIEDIRKMVNNTINAWQKYVPLDPDAIPVLKALKKNKILALITNFDHPPYVYSLLSDMKLTNFFDSIIISSEVGVKKPDPAIFSSVLKEINLKTTEICYVGDTREDMEAAFKANLYPIFIQRKSSSEFESIDDFFTENSPNNQSGVGLDLNSIKKITSLRELINIVN
ncbi:MAG: HAD family hydrolase [Promethearchaeota archaeon]|jgi:putative hydrolase of the HAD superfamily